MKRQRQAGSARVTSGRGVRRHGWAALLLTLGALSVSASPALAGVPGEGFLPQNRAWEMVSPPNKNGNDVLADSARARVAVSEGSLPTAMMFSSLGGFVDVGGMNNSSDYLSQRTLIPGTQGWSTHNLFPPQLPLNVFGAFFGGEAHYMGSPSADLSTAVLRSPTPVPATTPEVEEVPNLYLRGDLRNPGEGSYQLLSGCTFACSPTPFIFGGNASLAGASADLGKVVFTSENQLTEDATDSVFNVYKTIAGTTHFIGYVPVSPASQCTGVGPECVAGNGTTVGAGGDSYFKPHAVSLDGSRVFFADTTNDLYLRDDRGTASTADDMTTRLNASERASPGPAAQAVYWDAAADGSRAFFVSTAALTDDAPLGGRKLYRWSLSPDGDGHHLAYLSADDEPVDALADVRGTLGVSDDGSAVYFLQEGQIVAGEPTLGGRAGIYLWRPGIGVRYLGEVEDPADVRDDLGGTDHSIQEGSLGARVTPDGRHLLISLRQPPSPDDPDHGDCPDDGGTSIEGEKGCRQLYLYGGDSLTCVSCPAGQVGSPAQLSVRSMRGTSVTTTYLNHPLSDDGRYAFFSTADSLVAADSNGVSDAYVFDSTTGERRLLSSGQSGSDSFFLNASANGRDAFIVTRERLSAWDVDSNRDIYDARIDGGVPEPVPPPAACDGDSCQGLPGGVPRIALPRTKPKAGKVRTAQRRCAKRRSRIKSSDVHRQAAKRCAKARRGDRRRAGGRG